MYSNPNTLIDLNKVHIQELHQMANNYRQAEQRHPQVPGFFSRMIKSLVTSVSGWFEAGTQSEFSYTATCTTIEIPQVIF